MLFHATAQHPRGIDDVRLLKIRGPVWADGDEGPRLEMSSTKQYNLAAVVALRDGGGGGEDRVRLYHLDGLYVEPPRALQGEPYIGDTWRLGAAGQSFMLYFVMTNWAIKPLRFPESRGYSSSRLEHLRVMDAFLQSSTGPSLPKQPEPESESGTAEGSRPGQPSGWTRKR